MIAEIARDLRLLHRLSRAAGEPGDHDRPRARPISGAAHGEFQHRCKQPGLTDGELGGMDADGQPARAGIEVVAGEGALTARVELAIGIERERMRRDHRAPAQRGEHLRGPVLPAQSHERPQVTSRLHCAQSGRAVNVNARERRRRGRIQHDRHASGPDRVQDELDIVPLAPAACCRAAEIAPEDGRQCPIVREVEIADGGDGDVEVDGIDTSPEHAFGDAALAGCRRAASRTGCAARAPSSIFADTGRDAGSRC